MGTEQILPSIGVAMVLVRLVGFTNQYHLEGTDKIHTNRESVTCEESEGIPEAIVHVQQRFPDIFQRSYVEK